MAKSKLYEYAVLHHEPARKDSVGNETPVKTSILQQITLVLAESQDQVSILASRSIPESHIEKLSEVEIIVRPF